MKKHLLIITIIIAVTATSCKNEKSKSSNLNYNDSNPISMVLRGEHQIQASSEYDITYSAINHDPQIEVITVSGDGKITGKNVGTAQVKLSNGYNSMTVDVNVDLFTQPTLEFGCNPGRIISLYGDPKDSGYITESLLYYRYTELYGYSFACGEMDFFFNNGKYEESDVYIRPTVSYLLDNYLADNFNHVMDTVIISQNDTVQIQIPRSIYKYKLDESIICCKQPSFNQWDEILLFYFRDDPEKSLANSLKMRPRSSKFLY